MKKMFLATLSLVLLLLGASLSAKGTTSRITITGGDLATPVVITDSAILERFNVWAGAGVTVNDVQQADGFIIEWSSGVVTEPPGASTRYEVAFYVKHRNDTERLAYVVTYSPDSSTGRSYIYLPGRGDAWHGLNVRTIHRGVEGRWLHATREWEQTVWPLLEARRTSLTR